MFSELGWLDNYNFFINRTTTAVQFWANLAPLSPNMTEVLSEDNIQQCLEKEWKKWDWEWEFEENCVMNGKGNYSEEDVRKLDYLSTTLVWLQCFLSFNQASCLDFVEDKIWEVLFSNLSSLTG